MSQWEVIPGETPIDDISGLKIRGVQTRIALHEAEAENIRQAIMKYLAAKPSRRLAPFDVPWFKRLHQEMLGQVWTWAGTLRTCDLNLGVPWMQIEGQLHSLVGDLACWEHGTLSLLEQAVMLHHRAVHIHPYLNGNGRWARLLANIWLKQHGHPLTNWPETTIGAVSSIRQEYLVAIRLADQGEIKLLLELHQRYTLLVP
jgi:Fic-DOC domain mobile mystery protein B